MEIIERVIAANGLIFAFLIVGVITIFSYGLARLFKKSRMPGSAIAIIIGLGLSFLGNENGISDIPLFVVCRYGHFGWFHVSGFCCGIYSYWSRS